MLITAAARAESSPDKAVPAPFLKDEGSWVAGFLNAEGTIVVRPQHDLASVSPFADIEQTAYSEPESSIESHEPGTEAVEPMASAPSEAAPMSPELGDLAVNVPDLPQIIDRMGTAVLLLSVCLIAALIYRKRMSLRGQTLKSEPRMRIVGRMPVSRRGEVCLVEIDRRLMVVGLDAQGIRTLVPLESASPPVPTFAEVQTRMMAEEAELDELETPLSPPAVAPSPRPSVRRRAPSLFSR